MFKVIFISNFSVDSLDSAGILKRKDFNLTYTKDFDYAFDVLVKENFDLFIAEETPNDLKFLTFISKILNQLKIPHLKGILICSTSKNIKPTGPIKDVLFSPVNPLDFSNSVANVLGLKARNSIRYLVRMHLGLKDQEQKFLQTCVTINISKDGMLIETNKKLPIGKVFYWTFQGSKFIDSLTIKGKILNEEKLDKFYRYGICFEKDNVEPLKKLSNFLEGREND